ncbi:uncharacterized protein LOC120253580 isoform X2 [Dioscorea cayenensis subsp. rotundata]|uniref:Uncharacterized protein LOC120253580 isoform X2 n=1 Tax=Dioscorea cayennensis subsp. rotundata TaxID=55577 RepID=A0AB40ASV7_DIOCR|nr:uncharacterized protein LOC120253580 isoform X2 [Dioscorea cayenensis subsp. rotundata]
MINQEKLVSRSSGSISSSWTGLSSTNGGVPYIRCTSSSRLSDQRRGHLLSKRSRTDSEPWRWWFLGRMLCSPMLLLSP